MGFVRKSSKIALAGLIIAGMFMSSCGAWDWITGKQPKWRKEQARANARTVANWQQTLSKVNIKAIPKELRQCFKVASQLSGVPLPVLYAIGLNETGLDPQDDHVMANDGLEGKNWDCGIMQDNTLSTVCPLATRLAHHLHIFDINGHGFGRAHAQLLAEIEALGLKYVGGGDGSWCNNLTHAEAVKYCRELSLTPVKMTYNIGTLRHPIYKWMGNYDLGSPLTPNAACLSIFMGAYELAYDMWWQTYDSDHYKFVLDEMKKDKDGAYEYAIQHAGSYFPWVMVAYQYNGIVNCKGLKCYFNKFVMHINGVLSGAINVIKKL